MPKTQNSKSKLPAHKIHRLLDYLKHVGIDPLLVAQRVNINLDKIIHSTAEDDVPSIYYALIYKQTVVELENKGLCIPWAAGLGSKTFRMMCYCMLSCKTLGDALLRASEFTELVYPLTQQKIELVAFDNSHINIIYTQNKNSFTQAFAPANWSLQEGLSVAKSSGVETWLGFCGWLIGRRIDATNLNISGVMLSESYRDRLRKIFQCPIEFKTEHTFVTIPSKALQHRIVHDAESMEEFLNTGPFQLWSNEDKIVSTSAAIKSLLGTSFKNGIPSFDRMAKNLYMSTSTLRRHLINEGTSYQKIKDERRRDIAIELLCIGSKKISEISEEIGFADTSSFVRSFRNWTGITPKAYRDQTKILKISGILE